MGLEVLVSTMHQKDYNLLNKMNIQSDAVVINQCNINSSQEIILGKHTVKWNNSKYRGLSISRNMAIKNAKKKICVLADDDLVYIKNYEDIILKQFEIHPEADIITFQVEGIEKKFKNYDTKPRELNYLTSMKVSSVEIAFRLDSIKEKNIKFNEIFGSGAKFFSGEESIFLFDCLKKGLKIQYVPVKIADLHIGESSWFRGYDKEYFIAKGAAFTAMSKLLSFFLILQFGIRKYRLYNKDISMLSAIKFMLMGRSQIISWNNNCTSNEEH